MIDAGNQTADVLPCGLCEDTNGETMALMERVAMKDRQAMSALHAIWCPAFLGIACRILGERKLADRAIHQTFVLIWRRAADYNPHVSPPLVWAVSILRSECLRQLPKAKHPNSNPPASRVTIGDHPDRQRLMSADDSHRLQSALDQLAPEELDTLERAVFFEFACNHPSSQAKNGNLKSVLRSALDKIRTRLSLHEL